MGSIAVSSPSVVIEHRVLPSLVDQYAIEDPERLFAIVARDQRDISKGWRNITYAELSRAINSVAWYLQEIVGMPRGRWGDITVAYMGPNDIRYPVFVMAAMKMGCKTLMTSPRNSIEGFASLLEKTDCHYFFHNAEWKPRVDDVNEFLGGSFFKSIICPSYEDFLASPNADRAYPFYFTFEQVADRTAEIFQTSGSTGLPKPIYITYGWIASLQDLLRLPKPPGRIQSDLTLLKPKERFYTPFPAFHVTGAVSWVSVPVFGGCVLVLHPSAAPLNEDTFLTVANELNLGSCLLPPSFIEELSQSPRGREGLRKVPYVFYAGGPLSRHAGDRLIGITTICQMIGSTECGLIPSLIPKDRNDWAWFEWSPYYGSEMQPVEDTDLYELVLPNTTTSKRWLAVFHAFPKLTEWRTKDLFKRAPHNPNLYMFMGRRDDVIVLSNGEKWNPVSQEKYIEGHPLVRGALVVGQGRFQVGLIIEPDYSRWDPEKSSERALIDAVWPTVQEANNFSAGTGRIFKSMIMVTKHNKPFNRAGKGTIVRAASTSLYKKEIDAIYRKKEEADTPVLPEAITVESLKQFIRNYIEKTLNGPALKDDDDLFSHGFDSLQTMGLATSLRKTVETYLNGTDGIEKLISARVIYNHSTIAKLAVLLNNILSGNIADGVSSSREERIHAMVDKYTHDLRPSSVPAVPVDSKNLKVILTGSTGNLGTYFLHFLLSDPNVAKIYCFNLGSSARQLNQQGLEERGFYHDLEHDKKVEFLEVSLGESKFGLTDAKYTELAENVTSIIHNAWTVNFNHTLETFENPHIRGVRNFVDFSLSGKYRPHIIFISSIAGVGNWYATQDPATLTPTTQVPEVAMFDDRTPLPQGYGEGKHVSERILAIAAEKAGVPSSIGRVGQLCGPSVKLGKWNDREWVPSIVKTAKSMNKIPATLGMSREVDWICVDLMAKIVCELMRNRVHTQDTKPHDVFHLTNPHWASWSSLIPPIKDYFSDRSPKLQPARVVPYEDWLRELEVIIKKGPTEQDLVDKPALKIMDFFRGLTMGGFLPLATQHTQECSETMAGVGPVSGKLMEMWLEQWKY